MVCWNILHQIPCYSVPIERHVRVQVALVCVTRQSTQAKHQRSYCIVPSSSFFEVFWFFVLVLVPSIINEKTDVVTSYQITSSGCRETTVQYQGHYCYPTNSDSNQSNTASNTDTY